MNTTKKGAENDCLKKMEQARTERANNPDADKVLVGKSVQCRDRAENAAVAARVEGAAEVADKAKVVAVARDKVKIVTHCPDRRLLPVTNQATLGGNCMPSRKPQTRRMQSCQDLTEADQWEPAP